MLQKTKQTNEKLIMQKTAKKGMGYQAPETLSKNIQSSVQAKKEADTELRSRLTAEVRNEFPGASEETVNAMVTRKIYEIE